MDGEEGKCATEVAMEQETATNLAKTDGEQAVADVQKPRGRAAIKSEYRVDKFIPVTLKKEAETAGEGVKGEEDICKEVDQGEDTGGGGGRKEKKKGGMNKKRPRDSLQNPDDMICRMLMSTGNCKFGDGCRFSHDLADFLKRKPKDIGAVCPVWEMYGQCPAKITCRWGRSHYTPSGGEVLRSEEEGGVKPIAAETNELRKDLMWQLKKKTYPFKTPRAQKGPAKGAAEPMDLSPLPEVEKKLIDFSNKVYVAPLTTVGNLPFRRVLKGMGADITCGEMAVGFNLLQGQPSEWALLRRHPCEDLFGIQLAGAHADQMMRCAELFSSEVKVDFVDLNLGCPLDLICDQGMGSSLMVRVPKLHSIVRGMSRILGATPLTIKMRTGWDDKRPTAHNLVNSIQKWAAVERCNVAAVMVHGRSRQQRYTKTADWDYIHRVATSQNSALPHLPVIGNGDITSFTDYEAHKAAYCDSDTGRGILPCAMLGRGALIKPWLPTEIKEQRHWDISATERLDLLKQFVNFGLEHWGSDQRGVNTTRRFLLEWLSFLYRYVPVGLLEHLPVHINDKPDSYYGRNDLETLMASPYAQDWVALSEMLLGPTPDGFAFVPKHKANSYEG